MPSDQLCVSSNGAASVTSTRVAVTGRTQAKIDSSLLIHLQYDSSLLYCLKAGAWTFST
jgi:hypothetical protein